MLLSPHARACNSLHTITLCFYMHSSKINYKALYQPHVVVDKAIVIEVTHCCTQPLYSFVKKCWILVWVSDLLFKIFWIIYSFRFFLWCTNDSAYFSLTQRKIFIVLLIRYSMFKADNKESLVEMLQRISDRGLFFRAIGLQWPSDRPDYNGRLTDRTTMAIWQTDYTPKSMIAP